MSSHWISQFTAKSNLKQSFWNSHLKNKHGHILWLKNFFSWYILERNVYICVLYDMHMKIHGGLIKIAQTGPTQSKLWYISSKEYCTTMKMNKQLLHTRELMYRINIMVTIEKKPHWRTYSICVHPYKFKNQSVISQWLDDWEKVFIMLIMFYFLLWMLFTFLYMDVIFSVCKICINYMFT